MNLARKTFLLIAVPIICQLVFVIVLLNSVASLEAALVEESRTKSAISAIDDLSVSVCDAIVLVVSRRALGLDKEAVEVFKSSSKQQFERFARLTANDKRSKLLVERYHQLLQQAWALMDEIGTAYVSNEDTVAFSQFVARGVFIKKVDTNFQNLLSTVAAIRAHYKPAAEELAPRAIRIRQNIQVMVCVLVSLNILLAVALAFYYAKGTALRLQALMNNVDEFRQGMVPEREISGDDELAELDRRFRQAVLARISAEETQNAMMQIVAHDLRSPITSLGISLRTFDDSADTELSPKLKRFLTVANSETDRLSSLVSNILDFDLAERDAIEIEILREHVEPLLTRAKRALEGFAASKSVRVSIFCNEDLVADCDGERIIQVVVNLLGNAIKFAPDGSEIRLNAKKNGESVRVEVSDSGPGIPQHLFESIFDRYFKVDGQAQKEQGTGLGLWICNMIVAKHGGKIGVESNQVSGSTFWFELPIQDSGRADAAEC